MIQFLKTKIAAEYLGLSVRTLENWRYQGKGPKYVIMEGAIRYDIRDLDAWAQEHKSAA